MTATQATIFIIDEDRARVERGLDELTQELLERGER